MTDQQFIDVILMRAQKAMRNYNPSTASNPKIVVMPQYGKNIIFGIKFDKLSSPYLLYFKNTAHMSVFKLDGSNESCSSWIKDTIKNMQDTKSKWACFEIESTPANVMHYFIHAVIEALNTPEMSMSLLASPPINIFKGDETYETVSIEADMVMMFG